jgi:hypothetical protein
MHGRLAGRGRNKDGRDGIDWRVLSRGHKVLESHGLEVILANASEAVPSPAERALSMTFNGHSACMSAVCCVPASGPAAILQNHVLTFAR